MLVSAGSRYPSYEIFIPPAHPARRIHGFSASQQLMLEDQPWIFSRSLTVVHDVYCIL